MGGGPQPMGYLENLVGETMRTDRATKNAQEAVRQRLVADAAARVGAGPPADKIAAVSDVLGMTEKSKTATKRVADFVQLPKVFDVVTVVGVGATFVDQYGKSTARTTLGKLFNAQAAGGLDFVLGAANPILAGVDAAVGLVAEEVFGVKGISIAETENTAIRSTITMVEGLLTWDSAGMEDFHTRSMNGEYGPIFQKASEAGEWLRHTKVAVVADVAVEVLRPIDFDTIKEQLLSRQSESPVLSSPVSTEEPGTRTSGVSYETVPPPRERNKCASR